MCFSWKGSPSKEPTFELACPGGGKEPAMKILGEKYSRKEDRCKSPGAHLEYSRSPVSLEHSEEDEELLEIGSERKEGGKIS